MLPDGARRRDQRRRSARRATGRGGAAGRSPTRSTRAADVTPGPLSFSLDGLTFDVRTPRGTLHVRSHAGRPAERLQHPRRVGRGDGARPAVLARSKPASAALETCPAASRSSPTPADDVSVVVDYAHTDDALRNLLETARPLATGRVDHRVRLRRRSRSHQAAADGRGRGAAERPRRSSRRTTRAARIRSGSSTRSSAASSCRPIASRRTRTASRTPSLAIVDRREAIEKAIRDARPGDLVLIAGKGHEKYQVIGDRTLPFDDVEVARAALARRRSGSRVIVSGVDRDRADRRGDRRRDRRAADVRATRSAGSSACRSTRGRSAPGELFVAIRGDRFDGHEFVAAALAAGAAGAVVTATPAAPRQERPGRRRSSSRSATRRGRCRTWRARCGGDRARRSWRSPAARARRRRRS